MDCSILEGQYWWMFVVMVWGDFSVYTSSRLYQIGGNLTGSHCLNKIVHSLVTPALRHIVGGNQHDNVQSYQAGMVNDYIQQTNTNWPPWPTNSLMGKTWSATIDCPQQEINHSIS